VAAELIVQAKTMSHPDVRYGDHREAVANRHLMGAV